MSSQEVACGDQYSQKVDMFSSGRLLLNMCSLRYVFCDWRILLSVPDSALSVLTTRNTCDVPSHSTDSGSSTAQPQTDVLPTHTSLDI